MVWYNLLNYENRFLENSFSKEAYEIKHQKFFASTFALLFLVTILIIESLLKIWHVVFQNFPYASYQKKKK